MVGDRRRLEAPSSSTGSQLRLEAAPEKRRRQLLNRELPSIGGNFQGKGGRAAVVSEKVIVPEKLLNC